MVGEEEIFISSIASQIEIKSVDGTCAHENATPSFHCLIDTILEKYNIDYVKDQIYRRHREAELIKHIKYKPARIIQKYFRGYRVRQQLKTQNEAATIIQRKFFEFKARKFTVQLLESLLQKLLIEFFHANATSIQRIYRGYISRKCVFDYYKLKEWLRFIGKRNIEMKNEAKEYLDWEKSEQDRMEEVDAKQRCIVIATKLHHLVRTKHIPGVYSIKNTSALSDFEKFLKSFDYTDYVQQLRMERNRKVAEQCAVQQCQELSIECEGGKFAKCARHWWYHNPDLIETQSMDPKEGGTDFRHGKIHYPYMKSLFADEIHAERRNKRVAKLKQTKDVCVADSRIRMDFMKRTENQVNANYCQFHWK